MTDTRIEPTSSGFGVIRFTAEQQRAIRVERARRMRELRGRQGKPRGHTFTRRTYRRARAKALARLWAAYDTYLLANSRDAWLDVRIARWEAEQIVARGRREKGLWRA